MIKVAIAEDDYRVAMVHEQFLNKVEGVTVVGKALNARETLELLQKKHVDLLLLDIYMPDRLGTDLLPEIRWRHPAVDIVMITAANEKEKLEQSIRGGVFHYLIKPVQLHRFQETIEDYVRKRQMLKQNKVIDQKTVDAYLRPPIPSEIEQRSEPLPKGIDPITLQKIEKALKEMELGATAEVVAKKVGVSRTTARRYLEYMITTGKTKAELVYGAVGRPERKYYSLEHPSL